MCRMLNLSLIGLCWQSVPLLFVSTVLAQQGQVPSAARNRQDLQAPDLKVQPISPRLENVLKQWERTSQRVNKLEGNHSRWVYDLVFNTVKRSAGVFYYESPDKGRIDIEEVDVRQKTIPLRVDVKQDIILLRRDPKNGKPFTVESDAPEIWISSGQRITQIHQTDKTATIWQIPPQKQGKHIMDGPLPFMFGMPADQAKRRFKFTLINEDAGKQGELIHLLVHPRWQSDAANWKVAQIMLDKQTYLPSAVHLTDPSGNMITVYAFNDLKINNPKRTVFNLFGDDPFKYPLRGYTVKIEKAVGPQQVQGVAGQDGTLVPSVVGLAHDKAEEILKAKGFRVAKKRGDQTDNPKLLWHVQEQHPRPESIANPGQEVTLVLFDEVDSNTRTTAKPQGRSSSRR